MSGLYLEWITFIIVLGVGQFSPGPDMILLTRISLSNGVRAGYLTAFGIATGLTVHSGLAIFFVDVLTSELGSSVQVIVYALGACYLMWVACQLLRAAFIGYYSGSRLELEDGQIENLTSNVQCYWRGLLCNLLNPKLALFLAVVVLPFQQITDTISWSWLLWITVVAEGFFLWCVYVRLLQTRVIKRWALRNGHLVDGVFGVLLLVVVFLIIREMVNYSHFCNR